LGLGEGDPVDGLGQKGYKRKRGGNLVAAAIAFFRPVTVACVGVFLGDQERFSERGGGLGRRVDHKERPSVSTSRVLGGEHARGFVCSRNPNCVWVKEHPQTILRYKLDSVRLIREINPGCGKRGEGGMQAQSNS